MKTVYFYGLFMDAELLKQKGLAPTGVEVARLNGYGLRIGERASLIKSANEHCFGSVMYLHDKELQTLYREPSVAEYMPEEVIVTTFSGESVPAITYVLPEQKLAGKNAEYARSLAKAAKILGLPEKYIEEINVWRK